jgi:hypothetical protein
LDQAFDFAAMDKIYEPDVAMAKPVPTSVKIGALEPQFAPECRQV